MARYIGILPAGLGLVEGVGIGALRQKDIDDGRIDFHTQWSTWAAVGLAALGSGLAFTGAVHPDWSLPTAYAGLALVGEKAGEWTVQKVAGVAGTGGGYGGSADLALLDGGLMPGGAQELGAQPIRRQL